MSRSQREGQRDRARKHQKIWDREQVKQRARKARLALHQAILDMQVELPFFFFMVKDAMNASTDSEKDEYVEAGILPELGDEDLEQLHHIVMGDN